MFQRSIRVLAILGAACLAAPAIATAAEETPPPAAPAPVENPIHLNEQLEQARSRVLEAQRSLREANAALARASHRRGARASELERLAARQQEAQAAFADARQRVPALVAQARAAGMSDSALRSYEHSLYGN